MVRVPARLALPALLLLVSPAWADFSALSSDGFTYCFFEGENLDGDSCVDAEFVPDGDCSGRCTVPGSYGQISGRLPWEINADAEMIEGNAAFWTYAIIHGDRISDAVFAVSGACAYADPAHAGPPELAVFRFDGDPSVFDGTSAVSVSELLDLGLIQTTDLLYVNSCENGGQFDVELDVTGIPDDELVVFAGAPVESGSPQDYPVPAVSPLGTALLALLLSGVGAAILCLKSVRSRD